MLLIKMIIKIHYLLSTLAILFNNFFLIANLDYLNTSFSFDTYLNFFLICEVYDFSICFYNNLVYLFNIQQC